MTNFVLSNGNAQKIQNTFGLGFTLTNTGTKPAYLDQNSSVSPGTGYPLQPGVSVPIDANAVIWAVAAAGADTTISTVAGVSASVATVTNISGPVTVGPVTLTAGSTVSVTGPVSLAAGSTVNIGTVAGTVAISGAVSISSGTVNATLSGPVTISSGTVNLGAPVKLANAPVLIASIPFTVPAAAGTVVVGIGPYSLAPYASVIAGYTFIPSPTIAPLVAANYIDLGLSIADVNGFGSDNYDAQWVCDGTAFNGANIHAPVRNVQLSGSLQIIKGATAWTATGTLYIYGSNQAIDKAGYINHTNLMQGSIPEGGFFDSGVVSGAVNQQQWVATVNGPATFSVTNAGAAGGRAALNVANNGVLGANLGAASPATNGAVAQIFLPLPMRPVFIQTISTAGNAVETTLFQ